MTQEEKELLIKDLSARLPYGVKCQVQEDEYTYIGTLCRIEVDNKNGHLLDFAESISGLDCQVYLSEIKPYLFPLSSMTEGQERELNKVYSDEADLIAEHLKSDISGNIHTHRFNHQLSLDWYLKNHFDINGLIPMGLANDATGKNIY